MDSIYYQKFFLHIPLTSKLSITCSQQSVQLIFNNMHNLYSTTCTTYIQQHAQRIYSTTCSTYIQHVQSIKLHTHFLFRVDVYSHAVL